MSKPTLPTWDTNGTHLVAVTAGHKSDGLIVDEIPGSGEENAWRKGLCDFLAWQDGDETKHRFPRLILATNWAAGNATGSPGGPCLVSSGAGSALVELDVIEGRRLKSISFALYGDASADLTIVIEKHYIDGTIFGGNPGYEIIATQVATNPAAAWSDRTIRLDAHTTSGLSVTVANDGGGHGQYTRSAGSFLTEGFFVGQTVTWAGFANAGNNVSTTIVSVTDTVMDTNNATYVAEGPTAATSVAAASVAPTVDGTFALQIRLTASATGLNVKALRDTTDKPA